MNSDPDFVPDSGPDYEGMHGVPKKRCSSLCDSEEDDRPTKASRPVRPPLMTQSLVTRPDVGLKFKHRRVPAGWPSCRNIRRSRGEYDRREYFEDSMFPSDSLTDRDVATRFSSKSKHLFGVNQTLRTAYNRLRDLLLGTECGGDATNRVAPFSEGGLGDLEQIYLDGEKELHWERDVLCLPVCNSCTTLDLCYIGDVKEATVYVGVEGQLSRVASAARTERVRRYAGMAWMVVLARMVGPAAVRDCLELYESWRVYDLTAVQKNCVLSTRRSTCLEAWERYWEFDIERTQSWLKFLRRMVSVREKDFSGCVSQVGWCPGHLGVSCLTTPGKTEFDVEMDTEDEGDLDPDYEEDGIRPYEKLREGREVEDVPY